ncbi:MAG: methionine adenosyltransferase [Flavobacteriales bacterium]|nr:methionine adenosyltransferase [Flavobacteriales bacterium]
MAYLFTSESVSEGHPDKVADQISDAILDEFLRQDATSKVACETLVTTGLAVISGEVKTSGYIDVQKIVRGVINDIGYNKSDYKFDGDSCAVISTLHEQSNDINQGVERKKAEDQGAGDQGMMFGYATKETPSYMPLALDLSHKLLEELAALRRSGKQMKYLRPDSKSQVTIKYDDNNKPIAIDTIVISTQHDDFGPDKKMLDKIKKDVINILIPAVVKKQTKAVQELFKGKITYHVNPTGKFVIGGPHGDTGLTGRKIIVDTYGGKGAHGGGAFSGKDSSKVDRSAAYAMRHVAKNMVAAGVATEVLTQVAYAIGVAQPVGVFVNTYGTSKVKDKKGNIMSDGELAKIIEKIFDLRPAAIIKRFGLTNPIFKISAAYGHMGRKPVSKNVEFIKNGKTTTRKVEFFGWEKLDYVPQIKKELGLK